MQPYLDLNSAQHLVRVYEQYAKQHFEVIEATLGKETPKVGKQFLGYDLSTRTGSSRLWNGLAICYQEVTPSWNPESDIVRRCIQPLVCLLENYYKPRLNNNGLFDDYETGENCLNCLKALKYFAFETFPDDEFDHFDVVGVYRVPNVEGSQ